jgi:esterase/lipase
MQEISIPVSNQTLLCKLFLPSSEPHLTMVMVHGWTSSDARYLPLGERLASSGIATLAINLRGHGDSPYDLKQFSRFDHQRDVLAALDYMTQRFPNKKMCLLGKSYGGYLSASIASNQLVDFLILSHPALYPDEGFDDSTLNLIDENPDIFRVSGQTPNTNRAIKAFSEFSNPILFIISELDEEVPKNTTQNYLDFAHDQVAKIVIKDADHSLTRPDWREQFNNAILEWLENQER